MTPPDRARNVLLLVVMPLALVVAGVAMASFTSRSGDGDEADEPGGTVAERPLVVLVRNGGADGGNARIEVGPTGVAVVTGDSSPRPRVLTMAASDFSSLRNALERSRISTLRRSYLDPRAEIAFRYEITYQGSTVTADAGVVPPELQPVVNLLDPLL